MRDFTELAQGHIEAGIWWQPEGGPWDYAPRALLFGEAGGRVVNIGSYHYDYKIGSYLAAGPHIFDALNQAILSCIDDPKTVQ